jgi:DNA-binding CsgD family transcriptional regulator
VLQLVVRGHTNAEIGRRLGISARTVRIHTDALKRKLGVTQRRQLLAAVADGVLELQLPARSGRGRTARATA